MSATNIRTFWRKERAAYNLCEFWNLCHEQDQKLVDADEGMEGGRRRNPLPGYIGIDYMGVMVIAQNPAPTPPEWRERDTFLFDALDQADSRSTTAFRRRIQTSMKKDIQDWGPLTSMEFSRWGVSINEIAYLNTVKCATRNLKTGGRAGAPPRLLVRERCMDNYLCRYLSLLKPGLIVFRYSGVENGLNQFLTAKKSLNPFYKELYEWYSNEVRVIKFQGIQVSCKDKAKNIPRIQKAVSRLRKVAVPSNVSRSTNTQRTIHER